jgi:hypothetical protein
MAECTYCKREMTMCISCSNNKKIEFPDGTKLPSVPYHSDDNLQCHDCACPPEGYHHPGCDMERCPRCEGQLISCGCLEGTGVVDAKKRALSAKEVLKGYGKIRGKKRIVTRETKIEAADEADIYDLIADLLHLAKLSGLDVLGVLRHGVFHVMQEVVDDPTYYGKLEELYIYLGERMED